MAEEQNREETNITKIRKRDDTIVPFERKRITDAIFKAAKAVGGSNDIIADKLADQVVIEINQKFHKRSIPAVEEIQDIVEKVLIDNGHVKTAKAYILYRQRRSEIRSAQKQIMNGRTTKMPFTLNALKVLAGRYLQRDSKGNVVEIPEEMFNRVAKVLAEVEKDYGKSDKEVEKIRKEFEDIMFNMEFTPAGRTLTNAGAPTPLVSNCIVLHMEDSMKGIFNTLRDASLLQQAGSGLGFPFHLLRPAGSIAKSSRGVASGPVSFLNVYNDAFGVIKQQGRHGANMAIMQVDHPDILDFVHCKSVEGEVKNFNISVGLTDKFMEAVKNDDPNPWECEFKGEKIYTRRIVRDRFRNITSIKEEKMTAKRIFEEIVSAAWNNGEPGIVFLDTVNKTNPLPQLGRIEACNPCGEQFLHDGDVCNLGSINLSKFAKDGNVDYERLKKVTRLAVRMLDNVIDKTDFPVEKVNKTFKSNRRIGLGVMGFADMLYKLGIKYNSKEGFEMAEKVMGCIQEESHKMSSELAEEKGVFPNYPFSVYKETGVKMRNAALTTIAPTGTISMMFDVSSGLEPHFALSFAKSEVMGGQTLYYVNNDFEAELKKRGLFSDDLMRDISKVGTIQGMKELPEDLRKIFVTAMDIPAEDHIKMQSHFQKVVDNSISKTINFPNTATKEDVMEGYLLAWSLGCKGCTAYRDGSREIQVLEIVSEDDRKKEKKRVDQVVKESKKKAESIAVETEAVPIPQQEKNLEEFKQEAYHSEVPILATPPSTQYTTEMTSAEMTIDPNVDTHIVDMITTPQPPMHTTKQTLLVPETPSGGMLSSGGMLNGTGMTNGMSSNGNGMLSNGNDMTSNGNGFAIPNGNSVLSKKSMRDLKACPECSSPNITFNEGCFNCRECGFSLCSL
ncbi:MAG: adenosylcobalamin-dependent ribonucleoside-diphosphate reductase [Candidatus Aenigmatarchaeota archaeon]